VAWLTVSAFDRLGRASDSRLMRDYARYKFLYYYYYHYYYYYYYYYVSKFCTKLAVFFPGDTNTIVSIIV